MSLIYGLPNTLVEKEQESVLSPSFLQNRLAEALSLTSYEERSGIEDVDFFAVSSELPPQAAAATRITFSESTGLINEIAILFTERTMGYPTSLFAALLVHELVHVRQATSGRIRHMPTTIAEDEAYSAERSFLFRQEGCGFIESRLAAVGHILNRIRCGYMPGESSREIHKVYNSCLEEDENNFVCSVSGKIFGV